MAENQTAARKRILSGIQPTGTPTLGNYIGAVRNWALLQKDQKEAWEKYMAYTRQGGSKVFTTLLQNAGLESPFDENCLRTVCETAKSWLDGYDLTGIE